MEVPKILLDILQVLRIYTPKTNPLPPTPLESLKARLVGGVPDEAVFLKEEGLRAEASLLELLKSRDLVSDSISRLPAQKELFAKILEQLEVLLFLAVEKKIPSLESQVNKFFQEMVLSFGLVAVPAEEAFTLLEGYLERFEEKILLDEADGIYKFKISENDRLVHMPLLSTFTKPSALKQQAQKEADRLFVCVPQLSWLDIDHTVPMRAVSFLEIGQLAKERMVALVRQSDGQGFYWYLLDKVK